MKTLQATRPIRTIYFSVPFCCGFIALIVMIQFLLVGCENPNLPTPTTTTTIAATTTTTSTTIPTTTTTVHATTTTTTPTTTTTTLANSQDISIFGTYDSWAYTAATGWIKNAGVQLLVSDASIVIFGTTFFPSQNPNFADQKLHISDGQIWISYKVNSTDQTLYLLDYYAEDSSRFGASILWVKADTTSSRTLSSQPDPASAMMNSITPYVAVGSSPGVIATPTFSPAPGTYNDTIAVTVNCRTEGATIRYTTNGTTPSPTSGNIYVNPISISTTRTIKAIAYRSSAGWIPSQVATANYKITGKVLAPYFSPGGGTYNNSQNIAIYSSTPGSTIRYTMDGTAPTSTSGILFTGVAIPIENATTIKAIAYQPEWIDSSISSTEYLFKTGAPTLSVQNALNGNDRIVTITTSTSGATIRYTVDGSDPSQTNGTFYSSPISVTHTCTLKAKAFRENWSDSDVASTTFVSVTYDGNGNTGGSVPIDSKKYIEGASVTVLGNTGSLTKTGYIFAGWNTDANGTGNNRVPASTFTMGATRVTLYAKWTPLFTITYDGNGNTGGSVPVDNTKYLSGNTVTVLSNNSLEKAGYSFLHWNTKANDTGTNYSENSTFLIDFSDVTLYAQWALAHTITYVGNGNTGGSVPVDPQKYIEGAYVTVLGNTGSLVKSGYEFIGWNTEAAGTGVNHAINSILTMGSVNAVLYAKWSPTYTVTYNGNGNTGGDVPVDTKRYIESSYATTLGNTGGLVKSGYAFIGWNTEATGTGIDHAIASTFMMGSANVVLHAKWSPTYTVTYDSNGSTGGNVPSDPKKYLEGASITVLGNTGSLTKPGYTFAGWNTEATGTGNNCVPASTFIMCSDNVILYAMWRDYIIGDMGPAGGLVFYDKGTYSSGWRYMEAAPSDQPYAVQWLGSGPYSITGAKASEIGSGNTNTVTIVSAQGRDGYYAALICADLVVNGFDDWFLPSKDELDKMYHNLKAARRGGFANAWYWSSTEFSSSFAWLQGFITGNQFYDGTQCANTAENYKNKQHNVRAARVF